MVVGSLLLVLACVGLWLKLGFVGSDGRFYVLPGAPCLPTPGFQHLIIALHPIAGADWEAQRARVVPWRRGLLLRGRGLRLCPHVQAAATRGRSLLVLGLTLVFFLLFPFGKSPGTSVWLCRLVPSSCCYGAAVSLLIRLPTLPNLLEYHHLESHRVRPPSAL